MKRLALTALLAMVATGALSNVARGQSNSATALAAATVDRLAKGEFGAIVASFDEKMRNALPEDKLRAAWAAAEDQIGGFRKPLSARSGTRGDMQLVAVRCEFERGLADVLLSIDPKGQIAGLAVRPTPTVEYVAPSYVTPSAFSEQDVVVDAGGWPLPATLTMPTRGGPFPAVVLVHGSGPRDRDSTIGLIKPFRDLAQGLGSKGVAVLRYEKRTRQHAQKVTSDLTLTVKQETIDDAVAGVALLRATKGIDPSRVFVLGHSLGGMLAPRIAAAGGSAVRGLVVLAGAVRPIEDTIVDQMRYLSTLDGQLAPQEQQQLEQMEALAARVKALKPTDAPAGAGPFSAPAGYWIDLRGYDPPAVARAQKAAMLILQGERDYQVTMDDFAKWKAALGSRSNVTLKSYPALNHLFVAGTGRSTPLEYSIAGHVAEEVVNDIAAWIASLR